MIGFILKKIIGSKNDRVVKRLRLRVADINRFEAELQGQPDDALRQKTAAWKEELSRITGNEELARRLDEILPEAFAVVKNACRRLCGKDVIVRGHPLPWEMVPFDVQLIGGMALHNGNIAEMATGEGKTLVATLPVYLNALTGRGVHVVTVNDYLAARDSEWMGAVYQFLGLTVGCILHDQSPTVRREQYDCDITYGTNAEFGFDYLRDNGMATRAEEQVQRGHYFAIVDEVDSILIDEARTPLIISGPAVVGIDNDQYDKFKPPIENLVRNQERLCNRFLTEAEELIKKLRPEDGSQSRSIPDESEREIGLLLFRVKIGHPRRRRSMRLLEDPENLRLMNKAELELHADQSKKELYAQKEELFSPSTRRATTPTSPRRGAISSARRIRMRSCCRILSVTASTRSTSIPNRSAQAAGNQSQDSGRVRGEGAADSRHFAIAQSLLSLSEGRAIRRAGKQSHHRR